MLRKHEIILINFFQKIFNKKIESVRDGTVNVYFNASLRHYLLNFGLLIILQVEIVIRFL